MHVFAIKISTSKSKIYALMGKKIYILMLAMATGLAAMGSDHVPTDPKPDDIIARHIDAYGGKDAWKKVEAMELTGNYTSFSVVHDFYTLKTSDGHFFTEYNIGKNRVKEGYDGTTFWTIDPWQGFDFPRKINKAERHVVMQKAEFFTPFYRWKERGFEVGYKGTEDIDGTEVYVLTLTRTGMPEETWYIDANTFLVYKSITQWVDFSYPMVAETFYDDYRNVEGLVLPHYMEQTYSTRHTITEIDRVVINPVVNTAVFSMSSCDAMEKIAPLAGNWDIQVDMMTRSGNWHTFDRVVSGFEQSSRDVIRGNISYEVYFPNSTFYTLNFNRNTDTYQLVVYNDLYSVTELFNGDFHENGTLVFEPEPGKHKNEPGSDVTPVQTIFRYVLTFPDQNNFFLERQRSVDNGESWQEMERFGFVRKLED
jgi:hypothetical protein